MSTCFHQAIDIARAKYSAQPATIKGEVSASQLGTTFALFNRFHFLSSTPRCLSTNFPLPSHLAIPISIQMCLPLTNNLPNLC